MVPNSFMVAVKLKQANKKKIEQSKWSAKRLSSEIQNSPVNQISGLLIDN